MLSGSADTTVDNSATLTVYSSTAFAMQANTKYRLRGMHWVDTTAAGDFKYDFTGPTSPTLFRMFRHDAVASGTAAEVATDVAYFAATARAGTGTTGGLIFWNAIVHNGANTATFGFRWAQNTATGAAGAGATCRAGSYMEYSTA